MENLPGDFPGEVASDYRDQRASIFIESPERSRWPPLTRMLMSGEMSGEPPRDLTLKEKIDVWMVNEGYRRISVVVFALVHLMAFAFAFLNFDLKDNMTGARSTFGESFAIARAAALVLHLDVSLLLFRTYKHIYTRALHIDHYSCVPNTYISSQTDSPQRDHPIW